jgi:glycosyltransferase GT-like protein
MSLEADFIRLADELRSRAEIFDVEWLQSALRRRGHKVIADPAANDMIGLVERALNGRRPYSVVRLGDGEANLMTYGEAQSQTPDLDLRVAVQIIGMQADRFVPSHDLLLNLRDSLWRSVVGADIIGVLGLWTPVQQVVEKILARLRSDARGVSGQIRGRYLALDLPDFVPESAVFASAHLYVGVLVNLDRLFTSAERVVCITGRDAAVAKLRNRRLGIEIEHIVVGSDEICDENLPSMPRFLDRVRDALRSNAQGVLYLVGAGPWAKIYCQWIKERGGVGVDFGSGFDLLAGISTRPIHRHFPALFGLERGPIDVETLR